MVVFRPYANKNTSFNNNERGGFESEEVGLLNDVSALGWHGISMEDFDSSLNVDEKKICDFNLPVASSSDGENTVGEDYGFPLWNELGWLERFEGSKTGEPRGFCGGEGVLTAGGGFLMTEWETSTTSLARELEHRGQKKAHQLDCFQSSNQSNQNESLQFDGNPQQNGEDEFPITITALVCDVPGYVFYSLKLLGADTLLKKI
jgi:hypothetical protein